MRKVLYLVGKDPSQLAPSLLKTSSPHQETSVVLIHEAVVSSRIPAAQVYALSEDALSRGVAQSFPTVSYQDVLHMILEADAVVAL